MSKGVLVVMKEKHMIENHYKLGGRIEVSQASIVFEVAGGPTRLWQ